MFQKLDLLSVYSISFCYFYPFFASDSAVPPALWSFLADDQELPQPHVLYASSWGVSHSSSDLFRVPASNKLSTDGQTGKIATYKPHVESQNTPADWLTGSPHANPLPDDP